MEVKRINRWSLGQLLGKGSFGQIYSAVNIDTGQKVAIKMEPVNTPHPQIKWEAKVYAQQKGIKPEIFWFGTANNYVVLVMEQLEGSLMDPLPISLNAVARQMIDRIRSLHEVGFIHRDIKPENFLFKSRTLYLIDLGLAKRYLTQDGKHIPFVSGKKLIGTPRYSSINNQKGFECSRRDDLESICYVLIFLAIGKLPWQDLKRDPKKDPQKDPNKDPHAEILAKKLETPPDVLCKNLPSSFYNFLVYTKRLRFEEQPNYDQCIFWFQS
jgi:serine/threonine protein kinase